MTATAAPPTSSSVTPGRPSTTRVTILTGRRMTDLVLPSAAPIETYVDETVSVLADILEDTPPDVLAGFDFKAQGVWSFARPGAPPMKLTESLDDAGVVDGSLLTVVSVSRTERYRPLVEDVIDAIAVLDETPEFDRSALYRFVGLALPLLSLIITVRRDAVVGVDGPGLVVGGRAGRARAGLMGGSVLAQNRFDNLDMAESLLVSSLVTLGGWRGAGGAAAARAWKRLAHRRSRVPARWCC